MTGITHAMSLHSITKSQRKKTVIRSYNQSVELNLATVYNYLKGDVTHFPVNKMIGMGTPEELKATLDENSDFSNWAV